MRSNQLSYLAIALKASAKIDIIFILANFLATFFNIFRKSPLIARFYVRIVTRHRGESLSDIRSLGSLGKLKEIVYHPDNVILNKQKSSVGINITHASIYYGR
jgi:hypothetical protein